MVTGIAAFGVVTANIAAGMTKQRQPDEDISARLDELQTAINELKRQER